MFIGFFALESEVSFIIESRQSSLAPIAADALPTFRVYDGNTLLITGTSAAFDSPTLTGAYRGAFNALGANGFGRGKVYTIIAIWTVSSGTGRTERYTFQVT